jgi:hypothetical protein
MTDKDVTDRLNHVLEFTQTENTSIVYVLRGWFGNIAGIPGAMCVESHNLSCVREHEDACGARAKLVPFCLGP